MKRIILSTVPILILVHFTLADSLPGCIEGDNPGVLYEFGPMPRNFDIEDDYCKVSLLDHTNPKYVLKGALENYVLEHYEYYEKRGFGKNVFNYHKIYYKTNGEEKLLDVLRVSAKKWYDVEDAILDADKQPSSEGLLSVKYMTSECACVMRVYNLQLPDIPRSAETLTCAGYLAQNALHVLPQPMVYTSTDKQLKDMTPNERFPECNSDNYGVFNEFGTIPRDLNRYMYNQVPPVKDVYLGETLSDFEVTYFEYLDNQSVGPGSYVFLQIAFKDYGANRIIDNVRVHPEKWRLFARAVLETDIQKATPGERKLRIKYLTKDCTCIMRVYDLKSTDIIKDAKTMGCNEAEVPTNPHLLDPLPNYTAAWEVRMLGPNVKYSGCNRDNYGVFNEFGPLPQSWKDSNLYYKAVSTCGPDTAFQLTSRQHNYRVEYTELRQQYGIGSDVHAYHTLYYKYNGKEFIIEYLRVDPRYWKKIQVAMLRSVHELNNQEILSISYLLRDCTCIRRVYDLRHENPLENAYVTACNEEPLPRNAYPQVEQNPLIVSNRYPGCYEKNNYGVLNEFGGLPSILTNTQVYYPTSTLQYPFTQIRLGNKLENFAVQYTEYRAKSDAKPAVYGYHQLFYNINGDYVLIDNIRVKPNKWRQIEKAIISADNLPADRQVLRVSFLMSDCTCVIRVYDLKVNDIIGQAMSIPCELPSVTEQPSPVITPTTVAAGTKPSLPDPPTVIIPVVNTPPSANVVSLQARPSSPVTPPAGTIITPPGITNLVSVPSSPPVKTDSKSEAVVDIIRKYHAASKNSLTAPVMSPVNTAPPPISTPKPPKAQSRVGKLGSRIVAIGKKLFGW